MSFEDKCGFAALFEVRHQIKADKSKDVSTEVYFKIKYGVYHTVNNQSFFLTFYMLTKKIALLSSEVRNTYPTWSRLLYSINKSNQIKFITL